MARVVVHGDGETERETLRQEAVALAQRLAAMVRKPKPPARAETQESAEQPKPV